MFMKNLDSKLSYNQPVDCLIYAKRVLLLEKFLVHKLLISKVLGKFYLQGVFFI